MGVNRLSRRTMRRITEVTGDRYQHGYVFSHGEHWWRVLTLEGQHQHAMFNRRDHAYEFIPTPGYACTSWCSDRYPDDRRTA